jgi:hypothetical protein
MPWDAGLSSSPADARETLGFVLAEPDATIRAVRGYPARFLLSFASDGADYLREGSAYGHEQGALPMMPRTVLIILGLGILTTVTGCAVDASPSPSAMTPARVYTHDVTYQGQPYGGGINYEKKMDEEEQHYRRQRSAQEQAQERAHQQWEQERERQRDPRWER